VSKDSLTAQSSPIHIGPHKLPNRVVVAPMAGVSDLPLRERCVSLGAAMAVGEMLSSDLSLKATRKSHYRRQTNSQAGLRAIQIVGSEPKQLAEAARFNADEGADIIDINMGCPAKKVCKKAAGSALLANEQLVGDILDAVVAAVDIPVTLKIRTGITPDARNGVRIAQIAQEAGIQMLAVHGRTRADRFNGKAEFDTIADIVSQVRIPVLANGDITCANKAHEVLNYTAAAGVMIGRGAQGKPWLPGAIARALAGYAFVEPTLAQRLAIAQDHLGALHNFYGDFLGVRIARKHMGWFIDDLAAYAPNALAASANANANANAPHNTWHTWRKAFNTLEETTLQQQALTNLRQRLIGESGASRAATLNQANSPAHNGIRNACDKANGKHSRFPNPYDRLPLRLGPTRRVERQWLKQAHRSQGSALSCQSESLKPNPLLTPGPQPTFTL